MSSLDQIIGRRKLSSEYLFIEDIVWHGQCNKLVESISSFVIPLFGEDLFRTLCNSKKPMYIDTDILKRRLSILKTKYPGILEITSPAFSLTPLQSACSFARLRLAHALLDAGADATCACSELREAFAYTHHVNEYEKLTKKIIRRGGWFEKDAPSKYVLYKNQYETVVILLGISTRKRSTLLLDYRIPHDLIKVIAKYVL